MFEPEVASVVVRVVEEFRRQPAIVNKDCRYLFLLDAGLPDDPKSSMTPWVDLPSWLAEEALRAIRELQWRYPAITYLLSESNAAGRTEAERGRVAIAAGILRSLFCSQMLDSRLAPNGTRLSNYWNEVAVLGRPADIGMERVSHFIEFALDDENLPAVVAHEVLARWRKALPDTAVVFDLGAIKQDVLKALSNPESTDTVVDDWWKVWTSKGVRESVQSQFDAALAWMSDEQSIDDADFERLSALAQRPTQSPDAVESQGVWKRLKRALGFSRPEPRRDYEGDARAIKRRMMARQQVRDWLKFGSDFFKLVYSEDGPFHDTIYDTHYSRADWDQRTIVLKLRRLPLNDDCPPAVQRIVSGLSNQLPDLMAQRVRQSSSAEALIELLQDELCRRFKKSPDFEEDSTARWNAFGFVQWLASDPQLSRLLAGILSEQFIVPWHPIAGHTWQGHLAVLSHEVPGDRDRHGAVRNAWSRLAAELRRREPTSQPVIGSAQPPMADLNPETDLLWVRWPQVLSLGFFWFESSPAGRRFADDADHEALRRAAQAWVAAHPEDQSLFAFSTRSRPSGTAEGADDAEQPKEG
jgi:hypothetical protein